MIMLTKAQRKALKRIYDKQQRTGYILRDRYCPEPIDYRQFRKSVMGTIGMDNAVIVNWAGMWIAIECDGYTHT